MKKKSPFITLLAGFVLAAIIIFFILKPFSEKSRHYHILCMGDSLTESEFGYYPKHLLGLLKRKGLRVSVQTAARPGNTSGEYLDFIKNSDLLKNLKLDIAILMLGTNDVRIDRDSTPLPQYIKNMKAIIQMVESCSSTGGSSPVIFIVTIPPIFKIDLHTFSETSRQRVNKEINPAIRKIAVDENVNLLDANLFFRNNPELLPGIHPSQRGYYALANYIFSKILPFLKENEKNFI